MEKLVVDMREERGDFKIFRIFPAFFNGQHSHGKGDQAEELAASLLKLSSVKTVYGPVPYGIPVEKKEDAPWCLAEPLIQAVIANYVRVRCDGKQTIRKVLK